MVINLEGNGNSWSVQIHTAKTRREEKKKISWVVSVLTRVKIVEIRENYNSRWSFGLSSKGKAPAIPPGSELTWAPLQGHEAYTVL